MKVGDSVQGFSIVSVSDLPELKATGIFARHEVTGCEVYHLLNDDEENLFAYAFMTPPEDSTGVAHILEHSVLCGSRDFPLKDPFLVLSKQSVKTFLNAMTFPDKTVYPASSMVAADYLNLMTVYGDAVFFPLLEEWVFRQEGHRFEIGPDGKTSIQGVVFNEMRGNYSSFDAIAGDWTLRSLLSGTCYEHDSGGDPADIPSLTYRQFRDFHARYYHPSNCRIFLAGNMPTERQLALLQERFLSRFGAADRPAPVRAVPAFDEPRSFDVIAPLGEHSDPSTATVSLNWLLPDSTDTVALMEANLVAEVLLGHDAAPLSRDLLESALGEDIAPSSGLETEIKHMCFSVGLRGVPREKAGDFERLALGSLARIAAEGVPAAELETAIRAIDFSNREIRRSGGPFALTLMRRALRGWIHGLGPEATLRYIPAFEEVKRRVAENPSHVANLIRSWFVENRHRALVTVRPDADYERVLDEKLSARLAAFDAGLTAESRAEFLADQESFFARQKEVDSPEILARIPHLSLAELPLVTERVGTEIRFSNAVLVLAHGQPTNGIVYLDVAVPVDRLPPEDYPYLPLLSSVLTGMGLGSLDWAETSALSARVAGGLGAMLFSSSTVAGSSAPTPLPPAAFGRDLLIVRIKALAELADEAVDLVFRFLREADFSDVKRLTDVLLEYRNDLDSSIAPAGHQFAVSRAAYDSGLSRTVDEIWNGLSQVRFIRALSEEITEADRARALADRLGAIKERLCSFGMIVNVTGSADLIESALRSLDARTVNVPALVANPSRDANPFRSLADCGVSPESSFELVTSSLQVGFGAAIVPSLPYGSVDQPVDTIFGHWLSGGPLWEKVRTTGGAYGVYAYPDGLEDIFVFSTYRDPDPLRSLAICRDALADAAASPIDPLSLEKTVTGAYSREVQPRSPSDKGFTAFIRVLYGITDEVRERKLRRIVSVTADDMSACASRLLKAWDEGRCCALAGKNALSGREPVGFSGKVTRYTI